jgi:excisionase family DNA binding protein
MSNLPPKSEAQSLLGQMSREHALRGAAWVAEFLNVSESWVEEATTSGTLPSIKVGDAVRFDPDAIKAWGRGESAKPPGLDPYLPILEELSEDVKELKGKQKQAALLMEVRLLSKARAAKRLGIGDETLSYLIRTKQLSTVRVGKRLKIPARDVENLSAKGFTRPP